jgi:hypothetical protein
VIAELTAQQIEFAVAAFENVAGHAATGELLSMAERMRRAAPFLQLPWDEPTEEEWSAIFHSIPGSSARSWASSSARSWACEFVRRRNAALQPKPVDPRLEKIRSALVYHAAHRFNQLITPNQFDEAALAVLTALNEVK